MNHLRKLIRELRPKAPHTDADKLRMYQGYGPKAMRGEAK
jgi:hypothetical protein